MGPERVRATWAGLSAGAVPRPCPGRTLVLLVTGPGEPDLPALDALARLVLAARRSGGRVRVEDGGALAPLARLAGLDDVLG
jgi:hypothetical protein